MLICHDFICGAIPKKTNDIILQMDSTVLKNIPMTKSAMIPPVESSLLACSGKNSINEKIMVYSTNAGMPKT